MAYMRFGVTVVTAWTCVLLGNEEQCLMAARKDNYTSYLQTTPFNTTLHLRPSLPAGVFPLDHPTKTWSFHRCI